MFVSLEGIDGSGKTSVLAALKRRHRDWFFTAEPCKAVPTGRLLCSMLAGKQALVPAALPHLFQAARIEHQELLLQGLAKAGTTKEATTLVTDRWSLSTLVYQQDVWSVDQICTGLIHAPGIWVPDLTIWIDIDPAEAHARTTGRGEAVTLERLTELRNRYQRAYGRCTACVFASYGTRLQISDVPKTVAALTDLVDDAIQRYIAPAPIATPASPGELGGGC